MFYSFTACAVFVSMLIIGSVCNVLFLSNILWIHQCQVILLTVHIWYVVGLLHPENSKQTKTCQ